MYCQVGTTQVSIYDMQLQTKYKLLSELIWITDFIQNYFHTISLFICVRNLMYCLFMWNVYCIFCYIRYHTWYNYVHRKTSVLAYFSYLLIFVFVLTQNFIKNIPNVYFMAILMKLASCHVRNTFERPLRPNAPTVRVLTSVILKGIGWAFRKLYPTKIPGMVHQGLLAPQRLNAPFPDHCLLLPLYSHLLINLLVYSTYTENLICVILVMFLFSYSLYWISPRPNTADLALIRLTSYLYGLTCYLYGNPYTLLVKIHVQGHAPR